MLAFAVPIVPGRQEAWRRSMQEMLGSRRSDYEESRRAVGITCEQAWLTQFGVATFAVTVCNIAVPNALFIRLGAADRPFDHWLRGGWRALHGVDLAGPRPAIYSEPVYTWLADYTQGSIQTRRTTP